MDQSPLWGGLVQSGGRLNVARALQALLGRPTAPQPPQPTCEAPVMHRLPLPGLRLPGRRSGTHVTSAPPPASPPPACCAAATERARACRLPPRADAMVPTAGTSWSLSWNDAVWDLFDAASAQACQDACLSRTWCLRAMYRAPPGIRVNLGGAPAPVAAPAAACCGCF